MQTIDFDHNYMWRNHRALCVEPNIHWCLQVCNLVGCFDPSFPFSSVTPIIVCCLSTGLLMVVEYAANGNLRDFLRSLRPPDSGYEKPLSSLIDMRLTYKDLLSFAFQIARGMEYLSSKKVTFIYLSQSAPIVSQCFSNIFAAVRNISKRKQCKSLHVISTLISLGASGPRPRCFA